MTELNKRDYEAIIFALHFDGRTPIIERGFWNYDWKKLEQKCIEQSKGMHWNHIVTEKLMK